MLVQMVCGYSHIPSVQAYTAALALLRSAGTVLAVATRQHRCRVAPTYVVYMHVAYSAVHVDNAVALSVAAYQ